MKPPSRKLATGNLLLAIGVLTAYAVCGQLFKLHTDQWFLGFHAGTLPHDIPGRGPVIRAWLFPVAFESFILLRIIGEGFAGWKRATVPLSGWFGLIGITEIVIGPLLRSAWSALLRLQSTPPAYDLALAWYVWGSHVLYAFAGFRLSV